MSTISSSRTNSGDSKDESCLLSSLKPALRKYLTVNEEMQISEQFQGDTWKPNCQVLWSGLLREEAQEWADAHSLQTLTTAMGPFFDKMDQLYAHKGKSSMAWSKYVQGASAIFAWHIAKGDNVTVLSPPPPGRFHPSGLTNFQAIEEPILKGAIPGHAVRIFMVHPNVIGAENFRYQVWPADETDVWERKFGDANYKRRCWRAITLNPQNLALVGVTAFDNKYGCRDGVTDLAPKFEYRPDIPSERHNREMKDSAKNQLRASETKSQFDTSQKDFFPRSIVKPSKGIPAPIVAPKTKKLPRPKKALEPKKKRKTKKLAEAIKPKTGKPVKILQPAKVSKPAKVTEVPKVPKPKVAPKLAKAVDQNTAPKVKKTSKKKKKSKAKKRAKAAEEAKSKPERSTPKASIKSKGK
ncbi:Nn.00g009700.m01.CDS01 [Neocucurbitaria sp. VM-36]